MKMYVTNALIAEREERPSIRVAVLQFYASTITREKHHPTPVVFKTIVLLV